MPCSVRWLEPAVQLAQSVEHHAFFSCVMLVFEISHAQSLSEVVVQAKDINDFKNKLDSFCRHVNLFFLSQGDFFFLAGRFIISQGGFIRSRETPKSMQNSHMTSTLNPLNYFYVKKMEFKV